MRYLAAALVLALLASVPALAATAQGEDRLDGAKLLRDWDRLRYYNREMGLRDFSADVSCDVYANLLATHIGNASFRLIWKWPGEVHVVVVGGAMDRGESMREILRSIEGQMAQLIPKSITDTAAKYEIRVLLEGSADQPRRAIIHGTRLDVNNPVQSFKMTLDERGLEESTEYNSDTGRFRRVIQKAVTQDGRQLITDMVLEIYNENRDATTAPMVTKRIHWEFAKQGRFMLPVLMRIEYQDRAPMVFTLSNFKVNTGGKLPEDK